MSRATVIVHTLTEGGWCSTCGETREWLEDHGAVIA